MKTLRQHPHQARFANAGYSSVANIRDSDLEERMTDKINDGLTALDLTMDEYLHHDVVAN